MTILVRSFAVREVESRVFRRAPRWDVPAGAVWRDTRNTTLGVRKRPTPQYVVVTRLVFPVHPESRHYMLTAATSQPCDLVPHSPETPGKTAIDRSGKTKVPSLHRPPGHSASSPGHSARTSRPTARAPLPRRRQRALRRTPEKRKPRRHRRGDGTRRGSWRPTPKG